MPDLSPKKDPFPTTRWSLIEDARNGESQNKALNELCRIYRRPLLNYLHRYASPGLEAEDLAQEYLHHWISRDYWHQANSKEGKFRAFLLKDLNLFLRDRKRRTQAAKRGGDAVHVTLEEAEMQGELGSLPGSEGAEVAFDRDWACEVLQRAISFVQCEYASPEKRQLFDLLIDHVDRRGNIELFRSVGKLTGKSPTNVRSNFSELKKRLRAHLTAIVQETVSDDTNIQDELLYLFRVLHRADQPTESSPDTPNSSLWGIPLPTRHIKDAPDSRK